jgi:hypothetical protein
MVSVVDGFITGKWRIQSKHGLSSLFFYLVDIVLLPILISKWGSTSLPISASGA